jgi:hypothetical protein
VHVHVDALTHSRADLWSPSGLPWLTSVEGAPMSSRCAVPSVSQVGSCCCYLLGGAWPVRCGDACHGQRLERRCLLCWAAWLEPCHLPSLRQVPQRCGLLRWRSRPATLSGPRLG